MLVRFLFFSKRRALISSLCIILCLVTIVSFLPQKPSDFHSFPAATSKTIKGVWINYAEFADMINNHDQTAYCHEIASVLKTLADLELNTVFLHVHSHSDSFFPSAIFPWSKRINEGTGVDYDPLQLFVELAHRNNIKVHAWFNPYRVGAKTLNEIRADDPAFQWKDCPEHLLTCDDGVYYNPASAAVRTLVLSGVREVLENYAIDGIHYDDYFYPTTAVEFDRVSYEQYATLTDNPLPLGDWRRCQVNLLISGTYQLMSGYDKVVFGVSPAANLDNNFQTLYADVVSWAQGGYVDYLCPQLYFGFEYPKQEFRFERLLAQWQTAIGECPLIIGIASYKVGKEDAGSQEWILERDILARQAEMALTAGCYGVCVYSYGTLILQDELSSLQRMHLKKTMARFG